MLILAYSVLVLALLITGPNVWFFARNSLPRRTHSLDSVSSLPPVAVIIPACNEEEQIQQTIEGLLDSSYPQLQYIVVNDRSDDHTGEILRRLSDIHSELTMLQIENLPEGWLGKPHAMHTGVQQAHPTTEWFLFMDADVKMHPDAITQAISYAESHQLDHLTLMPNFLAHSIWERALLAVFLFWFSMAIQPWLIGRKYSPFFAGVGAFNLIRKSAYERVGGFERLKLEVIDDMELGRLMKKYRCPSQFLRSGELLNLRWQGSSWQMILGLEKNGFAAVEYSWLLLILTTIVLLGSVVALCTISFSTQGLNQVIWLITLSILHGYYAILGWIALRSRCVLPLLIPATLVLFFSLWRSACLTSWRGGVNWRGTFYSLNELKAARKILRQA